jgi:hypothetical protein
MPPSFSNEAAKISGAGLELSASSLDYAAVNEIADLKQVDVIFGVSLFAGSGEHDAFVVVVNPPEKFVHFRKRADLWKIFFSEQLGPVFIQLFTRNV